MQKGCPEGFLGVLRILTYLDRLHLRGDGYFQDAHIMLLLVHWGRSQSGYRVVLGNHGRWAITDKSAFENDFQKIIMKMNLKLL